MSYDAIDKKLEAMGLDPEGLREIFIQEALDAGLVVDPHKVQTAEMEQEQQALVVLKAAVDNLMEEMRPRIVRAALESVLNYVQQAAAEEVAGMGR